MSNAEYARKTAENRKAIEANRKAERMLPHAIANLVRFNEARRIR